LVNEVMRLMLSEELFTFVTAAPVEQPNGVIQEVAGTNNESERTLRSMAEARDAGRTTKTPAGARRRTIVTSVLESLRLYLATFTLNSVLAEMQRWIDKGRSCFRELLDKLKLSVPAQSVLDRTHPQPSG
jgi:transposase